MSGQPPERVVALLRRLQEAASSQGTVLRALGGVGVHLRAEGALPELERDFGDVDVVAPGRDRRTVEAALEGAGMVAEERFNARQGHRRQIWWTGDGELHVDVFLGRFEMCHRLDLDERLWVDHDALGAADLLLTKLQIVALNAKDVTDTARLLLTHGLGDGDAPGSLDGGRLVEVLAGDWGFYTTFTDNLAALPPLAEDARPGMGARMSAATAPIVELLERADKSRGFRVRAKVGRRKRWYASPEETLAAGSPAPS